ncbi:MAG: hypothetical protein COW65_01705 [Cytophagales bacterium CG18_big_fil_WC_8_21_14_2_50_42_9]|nr:MAG: hypothetical protein COW65_01705 [Cytophagales bacterium CG18_big_fil_WC_8_21_14_2_50_42_9]
MPARYKNESLWYILAAAICLLARHYLLQQVGLTDYDSVRSWQIVQEIGQGNFKNVFHHASPGFYLFYVAFTPFFSGVYGFIYLNTAFNIGAVLLLIRFMHRHLGIPALESFLVGLLYGLSVFAVSTGRNFATESISMFLFMLMLERYYRRLLYHDAKAFLQLVVLLAISLTVNYKFLLLLPVAILLELIVRDALLKGKLLLQAALIMAVPFVVFTLLAIAVHLPFYIYTAAVFNIKNSSVPNPAQRVGYFNGDVFYYFKYIRDFELPLIVPALFLFPLLYRREIFKYRPVSQFNIYLYIFWVSYSFLAGMHLLLKAPRGLTFIYGLLYCIFYLVFKWIIPYRGFVVTMLLLELGYQAWKLEQVVYTYSGTSYDHVAQYLKQQGITKIATTASMGLVPYAAEKQIEVKAALTATELLALNKAGFEYVLLDDYYKAANIQSFRVLETQPILKSWSEPSLLSPLVYLDHAEFNNLTYDQLIQNQQKALQNPAQLRLIKIP